MEESEGRTSLIPRCYQVAPPRLIRGSSVGLERHHCDKQCEAARKDAARKQRLPPECARRAARDFRARIDLDDIHGETSSLNARRLNVFPGLSLSGTRQARLSPDSRVQQFENDPLFGRGLVEARATTPGRP